MKSNDIAASLGVLMLGAGSFAPVISGPVLGSINLFGNGDGAGLYLFAGAVAAALALAANGALLAVLIGAACTALIGFEFVESWTKLQRAQESMAEEGIIGRVVANTFTLSWGWFLLIGGAGLILGGALFKAMDEDEPQPAGPMDHSKLRDDDGEGPDYVSIDAFAKAINRSPAQVLKGIKAGVLVGRFNGSEWQVHRSSLPRKSAGD